MTQSERSYLEEKLFLQTNLNPILYTCIEGIYNEYKAIYDFEGNILNGELPFKQNKLIEAWIIIHKEDLITLWQLMQEEGRYFKIKPL